METAVLLVLLFIATFGVWAVVRDTNKPKSKLKPKDK